MVFDDITLQREITKSMATGFTYGTIHLDLLGWECQISTGVGALGMDGIGSSARHVWRPISPSLNFCNFSFKRKVNETRMYDPTMSSFLSVDACLQDPTSAQGFNRYAYCAYNPLRYTDPTGWSMRYGSEIDPPRNPDDPPGYTQTNEDDNVIDYSKDDSLPEITINSNGTWSIPSVPDGHSGTPASQSGPYYQPAPNPGNGSHGGHGTGGNIGGGNKTTGAKVNNAAQITTSTVSTIQGWSQFSFNRQPKNFQRHLIHEYKKMTNTAMKEGELFHGGMKEIMKNATKKTAMIGVGLEVVEIATTGEVGWSNAIDGALIGIGFIPVAGWIIDGAYLITDLVVWGVTGSTIGEKVDKKYGTVKIY